MTRETDIATLIERTTGIRRDLDKLEASLRWLWRTVLTAVISGTVALLFSAVRTAAGV